MGPHTRVKHTADLAHPGRWRHRHAGQCRDLFGHRLGSRRPHQTGVGTLTLSGDNSYSGATFVNQDTLAAGAAETFSPASAMNVAVGAILDLASLDQTVGSFTGGGNVLLGSADLTTGGDGTSTTFSGVISGAGGLVKVGGGAFTLTGDNSYSSATLVNQGTLAAGAILDLASLDQTVGSLAGGGNVLLGSADLTTGGGDTSTTFSGVISGAGGRRRYSARPATGSTRFRRPSRRSPTFAYVNLHTNGFTETGGAAALAHQSDDTDQTFTTLGIRASTPPCSLAKPR